MKKLALIFCLLIFTTSIYAIDSYNILWIKEDNVYVTTSPNATIYKTCYYGKDEYSTGFYQSQELRSYKEPYRKIIDYTYFKTFCEIICRFHAPMCDFSHGVNLFVLLIFIGL